MYIFTENFTVNTVKINLKDNRISEDWLKNVLDSLNNRY